MKPGLPTEFSGRLSATGEEADLIPYLKIYLNHHWAGAGAGVALARRIVMSNRGTAWSEDIEWVKDRIEADEHMLTTLRRQLGIRGGLFKRMTALAIERLSRLKANGRVGAYSPLNRVIEIEAMIAGISGKLSLWVAMQTAPGGGFLTGFDFPGLERSARAQLDVLARIHKQAAGALLASRHDVKQT